ncbi:MAG TPA: hypothetical protein VMU18_08250 [Rhodoblastus sp.]|nr:hypothetical protein [Rhodoblastus sp.]
MNDSKMGGAMVARCLLVIVALAASVAGARAAEPALDGVKSIVLHTVDGKAIVIGRVTFTPEGDHARFKIAFDDKAFAPYFLSMREFKCVEGAEILCHVPYPYPNPQIVSASDLSWLEHALLFLYKRPRDYVAKLSQGLIYKLAVTPEGLVGTPQSIDLDEIAVPPDNLAAPYYSAETRVAIEPGTRWFERLTIETRR